jgi:Putative Flp pilus-assembly TadE/G-like
MLIQIVFFIFMLVSIAALYVDLGVARLTQTQMQNAADTAALEGLRQRDATSPTLGCPAGANQDQNRRCAANRMAAMLEAGPQVTFKDDAALDSLDNADLQPSRYIDFETTKANPAYIPNLESNTENLCHGDMVSGTYQVGVPSEDSSYLRSDFVRAGSAPPTDCTTPTAPADSQAARSFLVRLRRTSNFQDLDNVSGVSSKGPTVPLLFGQASTIQRDTTANNPNNYSPRLNGITVRGTAIADSRPALRVGSPNGSLPGVTPFAVTLVFWTTLASGIPQPVTVDAMGNLKQGSTPRGQYSVAPQTVGMPRPWPPPVSSVTNPTGYVPIYEGPPNLDVDRVIGFGFVTVTGSCSAAPGSMCTLTGAPSTLASANATAVIPGGLPVIPGSALPAVLMENRNLGGALLAPFLAR